MWQPSVTTKKEYKNSYRARVGLFMTEFVISVCCSDKGGITKLRVCGHVKGQSIKDMYGV